MHVYKCITHKFMLSSTKDRTIYSQIHNKHRETVNSNKQAHPQAVCLTFQSPHLKALDTPERQRGPNTSNRLTRFFLFVSHSTFNLSIFPAFPDSLSLPLFCLLFHALQLLSLLLLISPFYLAATPLFALILHHRLLLSLHRCLSFQFLLFFLPPFPLSNLTHHVSNHPAKCALFLHHAVPHHGVQRVFNSPVSLEAFYLPEQCLSVVSGNSVKQIEQVEIGRDCVLFVHCLFPFKCRHLHFSRLSIKLCYEPNQHK